MDKTNKIFVFVILSFATAIGLYIFRPQGLYFLADDFIHIPASANNLLAQRNSLRPIGNISLHIDYLFSNTSALGYHITNLLLHIINTFFVFILSSFLIKKFDTEHPSKSILSTVIAVVFFVYPFHSESVFWVIGRSGSLGVLFFLPAVILFIKRREHIFYFIASMLCFILALLAYESSWIFPVATIVIALADIKNKTSNKKKELVFIGCTWLVFAIILSIRFQITGNVFNQYDTSSLLSFNVKNLISNFFRLFGRTLIPPFARTQSLLLYFLVAVLFLIALVVKFFRHPESKQLFYILSACWIISYLPYLSLGIDTHGVEGERYLYLPSIFFCLWLAYILNRIFTVKWFLAIISIWLCMNLFFLHQSRTYYGKSALITQATLQQIGNLTNKQHIYLQNLPQYNNGAVLFRLGFEEAIHWLQPLQANKITILSIDSSDAVRSLHYNNYFKVREKTDSAFTIDRIMEKDKSFITNYISTKINPVAFNKSTDGLLIFSDTALTVIK